MTKNQFLNWESVFKLPKMQFHEKIMIYLISGVFLAWIFLNFLARCEPAGGNTRSGTASILE